MTNAGHSNGLANMQVDVCSEQKQKRIFHQFRLHHVIDQSRPFTCKAASFVGTTMDPNLRTILGQLT